MNSDRETVDETARLRQAFAARSLDAVPAADCPPAERLWNAARGSAGGSDAETVDVRELIEHVAVCGACAEAWRLARELDPAAGASRSAPPAWWRQPLWTVAAAALVILAFGLSWRQPPPEGPAATVRGLEQQQAPRTPEDGGRLSRRDPLLSWQATEDAVYDLVVMTDDLDPIVEVYGLESAEYRILDEDLSAVPPGAGLLWHVAVTTPDGVSRSATYRLVVGE